MRQRLAADVDWAGEFRDTAETLGRPHVVLQEVDVPGQSGVDAVAEATLNVLGSWPSGLDRSGGRPVRPTWPQRWRERAIWRGERRAA